jgi:hypothetical protein
MIKHKPIEILPLRRGVVLRGDKITDSYGTEYVRDENTGALTRVSPKAPRNPPKRLFDLDAVMNAVEIEKQAEINPPGALPEVFGDAESFGDGDPAAYGDSN